MTVPLLCILPNPEPQTLLAYAHTLTPWKKPPGRPYPAPPHPAPPPKPSGLAGFSPSACRLPVCCARSAASCSGWRSSEWIAPALERLQAVTWCGLVEDISLGAGVVFG